MPKCECSKDHFAWELHTAQDFEDACRACEVVVPEPGESWPMVQQLLESDMRKDGPRGLALLVSVPALGLDKGDRLDPTCSHSGITEVAAETNPHNVMFWQRSKESLVLHRNPPLNPALGLDLPAVVALDLMHTFCLGIHQQFVSRARTSFVGEWQRRSELATPESSLPRMVEEREGKVLGDCLG